MKKDEAMTLVLVVTGAIILTPIIIRAGVALMVGTYTGISTGIEKFKFNRKIKQGMKDGSIVEIDGKYYEVKTNEED